MQPDARDSLSVPSRALRGAGVPVGGGGGKMTYQPCWALYPPQFNTPATNSFVLDAAEELIGYVITIPKTGTLKKVGWGITAVSSPVLTARMSLENIAAAIGQPVATTDAAKNLYAANAVSADITNPSAGIRFDAINGSTGISVTKGDRVAITIRITSYTSGSISVRYSQYGGFTPFGGYHSLRTNAYTFTYVGGSWKLYHTPHVTLEFDGEFVPVPFTMPAQSLATSMGWNSTSNPDRRGMKFSLPFTCKLGGAFFYFDGDSDTDLILYEPDGYTVATGFPITLNKNERTANSLGWYFVEFPVPPTITADLNYRFAFLPKENTNCTMYVVTPESDGEISGLTGYMEGSRVVYTYRNGAPSSGDKEWTDSTTQKSTVSLFISEIDIPSGGSGGGPIMGGMVVR